jgi:hypothetical protein
MERAVIHSDLKKQDIQPQQSLGKYLALLKEDIKQLLPIGSLHDASCPVTDEQEVRESFWKMGMNYKVSQTFENIYLSPRPKMDGLKLFYRTSSARKFWLTELWPQTQAVREEKIILPQLEWAQNFISQYLRERKLRIAEFLPSNWCYFQNARKVWPEAKYQLVDHLFDLVISKGEVSTADLYDNTSSNILDTALLFETLDRAVSPNEVLKKVKNMLKPGGLCFITCLLSSGFEVKVLEQESEIFTPPERMNILSYEGIVALIDKVTGFEILEFSTPGVLDIPNVVKHIDQLNDAAFYQYIFKQRQDTELVNSFQDFLQRNRLGTFGRIVLRKK